MKKKRLDRRIQRTHNLLKGALMSLVPEKGYDAITVQDILDRADVGRSTFYLHFGDKDALLRGGLADLHEELRERQREMDVAALGPEERLISFSGFLYQHAYEHRDVFWALGKHGGAMVRHSFHEMLVDIINERGRDLFRKRSSAGVPSELFVHFLASSFLSVMEWWLEQKKPVPPETINGMFRSFVMPSISAQL
ncbi:MAG: TetR/AcrR family transcriptional regulator [Nitrospinae bacterium]|nr:TetR/AcrR family transcriptional regulator [Nitrospinota bacterium]